MSEIQEIWHKAPIFAINRLRKKTNGHGVTTLVCFIDCLPKCNYSLNRMV